MNPPGEIDFTSRSSSVNSTDPRTSTVRLSEPDLHRIVVMIRSVCARLPQEDRRTSANGTNEIASEQVGVGITFLDESRCDISTISSVQLFQETVAPTRNYFPSTRKARRTFPGMRRAGPILRFGMQQFKIQAAPTSRYFFFDSLL
jgi:hypothetical protein